MKRSKHSLSSTHLTSFDMGELVPIGLHEVLPGDSFQMSTSAFLRCAPMVAPPMHPVRVRIHHWYVPFRLLWDNFEKFITGGPDGNDASVFPTMAGSTIAAGSLLNYLGLPVGAVPAHSALPVRAYALIFNEWYRDQDLVSPVALSTADGVDATTNRLLLNCAWNKDYFTSARPWEQKGPAVSIPVSGSVAIVTNNLRPTLSVYPSGTQNAYFRGTSDNTLATTVAAPGGSGSNWMYGNESGLQGSISGVNIQVRDMRQSLAIQRFEEARARYGSRYSEYLLALGVRSSDARLQRPEYLGGGISNLQFSEVLQTAQDGTNPVGTLRGHGITGLRSNKFRRFFEEHGYIVTLCSILPTSIYMNGMQRTWNRRTKYDFWQKELENIGQQAILNKEIRAAHASPDGVFGYQDRYDEYRRTWSRVTGEFSTSVLNFWHFGRDFASDPALNSSFVQAVPPKRPFASTINDVIYAQFRHRVVARRLVSKFAINKTF